MCVQDRGEEKGPRYDLLDELIRKYPISLKYRNAFHRSDDDSIAPLCRALDIMRYQPHLLEALSFSASILFRTRTK